MIVIPALDVRRGSCAQLDALGAGSASPLAVARDFAHAGFGALHVIDLDAVLGSGENHDVIEEVVRDGSQDVQVGGGVRSADHVERLFDIGAAHVIVGQRAIDEPEWLAGLSESYPGLVMLAVEAKERRVLSRSGSRFMPRDLLDLAEDIDDLPLAGLLVSSARSEGDRGLADLTLLEDLADRTHIPIMAAGGVMSEADLRALEHRGAAAAIVGRALYSGALDARRVAQEFSG